MKLETGKRYYCTSHSRIVYFIREWDQYWAGKICHMYKFRDLAGAIIDIEAEYIDRVIEEY